MRILAIAAFELKSFVRNFRSRAIIFLLPIFFIGIFGFVFGTNDDETSFTVALVTTDDPVGSAYLDGLKQLKNGVGTALFTTTSFDSATAARQSVEETKAVAVVEWLGVAPIGSADPAIRLSGNERSAQFMAVRSVIGEYTGQFLKLPSPAVAVESIAKGSSFSGFQLMAPGLIVYGVLIMIPQVAGAIGKIRDRKYHFRYFTSRVRSIEIVIGNLLALLVLVAIQTVILFGTAIVMGFQPQGSLTSAFLVALPTTIFTVGLGILLAALTRESDAASNLGTLLGVVLGFLSGSFVPVPEVLVPLAGRSYDLMQLTPTRHSVVALSNILLYGRDLDSAWNDLATISTWAVGIILIAAWLYERRQFRQVAL